MPFGKYKKKDIHTIPKYYLKWLLEADWFKPGHLRDAVEAAYEYGEEIPEPEYMPPARQRWCDVDFCCAEDFLPKLD